MAEELYIGLMSGTSLDAIDCAICSFGQAKSDTAIKLHATYLHAFPESTRNELLNLINNPDAIDPDALGPINKELGHVYADAIKALLTSSGMKASDITAVGNHGQTVLHKPDANPGFSVQVGDAQIIARETGITTVFDFRSADIELGGQGAPLAPCFHDFAFAREGADKIILNIGGIANITLLAADGSVIGFDTGPGNTLLDIWSQEHRGKPFDKDGVWAESGSLLPELLDDMMREAYFDLPHPKSTGRELFNRHWLTSHLDPFPGSDPADVQNTLAELTASSIAEAIKPLSDTDVLVCGGGAFNTFLMSRIAAHLSDRSVAAVPADILPPDWVEAAAFAWLARARIHNQAAGLPSVTGATAPALLGRICKPAEA